MLFQARKLTLENRKDLPNLYAPKYAKIHIKDANVRLLKNQKKITAITDRMYESLIKLGINSKDARLFIANILKKYENKYGINA